MPAKQAGCGRREGLGTWKADALQRRWRWKRGNLRKVREACRSCVHRPYAYADAWEGSERRELGIRRICHIHRSGSSSHARNAHGAYWQGASGPRRTARPRRTRARFSESVTRGRWDAFTPGRSRMSQKSKTLLHQRYMDMHCTGRSVGASPEGAGACGRCAGGGEWLAGSSRATGERSECGETESASFDNVIPPPPAAAALMQVMRNPDSQMADVRKDKISLPQPLLLGQSHPLGEISPQPYSSLPLPLQHGMRCC